MRDDDLLEWIGKNYYISPVLPVLIGSCFLVTYVAPLGPNVIQALSYIDVFNFSLLAVLFCLLIALEVLLLYGLALLAGRLFGWSRPSRASGFRIIITLAATYVGLAIVTYFAAYDFYDKYLDLTLLFIFMPLAYLVLFANFRDVQIILSLAFLTVYAFLAGMTFGYLETTTLKLDDEVCTDTCHRVDVYVILSAYVVAFDANGQTLLFKRDTVRSMKLHRDIPVK